MPGAGPKLQVRRGAKASQIWEPRKQRGRQRQDRAGLWKAGLDDAIYEEEAWEGGLGNSLGRLPRARKDLRETHWDLEAIFRSLQKAGMK